MTLVALFISTLLAAPTLAQSYASTTTFTFAGNALPTGLVKSDWPVNEDSSDLLDRLFVPENVQVRDGFLDLIVPGGQSESPILCAEIGTTFENILYASVRTYAILTEEPGTCNGMFMYYNRSQETDIEWISDPESFANIDQNNGSRALLYTNQGFDGNNNAITVSGRAPSDATSAVHEYRLDWAPGVTRYYLDGVLHQTIDRQAPSVPGQWLWNNWVNGDPYFTAGPPADDAIFRIRKIVMYYNTA